MIDRLLSRSVVAFVGSPGRLDPIEPEQRVVAVAGDAAVDVVPRITAIVHEMHAADPPLVTYRSIGDAAEDFLRQRHPELADDAIEALVNRFCFEWK